MVTAGTLVVATLGMAPAAHAVQVIDATIGTSVSLDASSAANVGSWTLATTGANTQSGGSVSVNSNSPYTLSVTFDKTRMSEWDTNTSPAAYVSSGKTLAAPLTVTVSRTSGTAGTPTLSAGAVSGTSTLLSTGLGLGSDNYAVSLSQPTTIADSALASGRTYHIVLTYTASSTLG
jgi:hypothetical protein